MKSNYNWQKIEDNVYSIYHEENGTHTFIAETTTAEKAHFITEACNQFNIEQHETVSTPVSNVSEELIAVYEEYIELLVKDNKRFASFAASHKFFSTPEDISKGIELRKKIAGYKAAQSNK